MAKDRFARRPARRITPAGSMKEFVGGSSFLLLLICTAAFAWLHNRVITQEMQYGTGGLWCYLGQPAVLCLLISTAMTYLTSKTRLLPAGIQIIGLSGMGAALIMFFVIVINRMGRSSGMLNIIQEVFMLAFLAAWFLCVILLMLTGVGLRVAPAAGMVAATITIVALLLFVIRAMLTFSSLITSLNRDLLIPDGTNAQAVEYILRSVPAGHEMARDLYFSRIFDNVGTAAVMFAAATLGLAFNRFFAEQSAMIKYAQEIPLPAERRNVYSGYDEYTADALQSEEHPKFQMTSEGYYVEKKETSRGKFKRREHTEKPDAEESILQPGLSAEAVPDEIPGYSEEADGGEEYDDYIPGEGWGSFVARTNPVPARSDQPDGPVERKRVTLTPASKPAPDPNDPGFWDQYSK